MLRGKGAEYVAKQSSVAMWTLDLILWPIFRGAFMRSFWTTLRMPWWSKARIYYPEKVANPEQIEYQWIIDHEWAHVERFEPRWGPYWEAFLFVLPFYGRWVIERYPFLSDIDSGKRTPEGAADVLWRYYGWPWPKLLMVAWFVRERER